MPLYRRLLLKKFLICKLLIVEFFLRRVASYGKAKI